MLIDTHAHIYEEYYENIEELMQKLKDIIIIVSGVNDYTNKEIIKLCNKYENIYGTLGIHPSEMDKISEESYEIIENNINNQKIVGIGEIGLDYYYGNDKKNQKQIFTKMLDIANNYNKPVVIHSRNALEDTYNILKDYKHLKKILHCYSYDYEAANKFISINCKLGINGIITFKNSNTLKEVVLKTGLEHLLLETDSPYLTPVPFRGKQNDSSKLEFIAEEIAKIKSISKEEVCNQTTINAIAQFDLNLKI